MICGLIGLTASQTIQAQTFPQGAAGTPLPAKTDEAAKNWTPELKAQIDALLDIFANRTTPPSTAEIEQKLNVKLIDSLQFYREEAFYPFRTIKQYVITETPFAYYPTKHNKSAMLRFQTYEIRSWDDTNVPIEKQTQTHSISLPMPQVANSCLNPYDLTIYVGEIVHWSPYSSPHNPPKYASTDRYDWSMFNHQLGGHYHIIKKGLSFELFNEKNSPCVNHLTVSQTFKVQP